MLNNKPIIYLRVSSLSHIEFCPKRSRIESFTNLAKIPYNMNNPKDSIATGIRLHYEYSYANRTFDRVRCKALLGDKVFSKHVLYKDYDVIVRGLYDDLNVLLYNDKKYTSLIELKTTRKKYLWSREVKSAIRQLELYQWLLKENLERIGYPLWKRSYLLIYSQNTGELLRRIPVQYNEHIEQFIELCINQLMGLSKVSPPPYKYCRLCPSQIRSSCDWYLIRSGKV